MVEEDFRQRLIVRQSCLDRAVTIITTQMNNDVAMNQLDDGVIYTLTIGLASKFESWVFRKEMTTAPVKEEKKEMLTMDNIKG